MNTRTHWESVYSSRAPNAVSWYRRVLNFRSISLSDARSGDVGVDHRRRRWRVHASRRPSRPGIPKTNRALDVSKAAIEATRERLGRAAERVHWILGDITAIPLSPQSFDVWHDRAVFHFLTEPTQRQAYVRSVLTAVRPGGHVIVSTFGPEGPTKCSGLDVMRYDAETLHREFGKRFRIEESSRELHRTPWGTEQQFVYCCCRVE